MLSGDEAGAEEVLAKCLAEIGADSVARGALIQVLLDWEERNFAEGRDVRGQVSGPLVDAVHGQVPFVSRVTATGLDFEIPYDSRIAREVAMGVEQPTHIWEPQTTRLLRQLGASTTCAIIGGAYVGDHALPLAQAIGDEGAVYAFEPQAHYANALRRNAVRNLITNIIVIEAGLWSTQGRLMLEGQGALASPAESHKPSGIPCVSIDSFMQENRIDAVQLVMLDIEGGELEALRGARTLLAKEPESQPKVIFEVHRDYVDWSGGLESTEIVKFLISFGYTLFGIRDFQANISLQEGPIEIVELEGIYLEGPAHGFNMLALPDGCLPESLDLHVVRGVSPKLLRHRRDPLHQPTSATDDLRPTSIGLGESSQVVP